MHIAVSAVLIQKLDNDIIAKLGAKMPPHANNFFWHTYDFLVGSLTCPVMPQALYFRSMHLVHHGPAESGWPADQVTMGLAFFISSR